jgi:hypothetical protein
MGGEPLSKHLFAIDPDPLIDPRPCLLCGFKLDRHEMIDDGDGPIFYCPDLPPDQMDMDELERRAELRRQEEVAAILARWDAMDAMDRPAEVPPPAKPPPYRTAASTIDAFWYVVGLREPERFKAWMHNHPQDALFLLKLLETK